MPYALIKVKNLLLGQHHIDFYQACFVRIILAIAIKNGLANSYSINVKADFHFQRWADKNERFLESSGSE